MRTKNIWLIDPGKQSLALWREGDWVETHDTILPVIGHASIYLDMEWVWQEVADSQ